MTAISRRDAVLGAASLAATASLPTTAEAATTFKAVPKAMWVNLTTIDKIGDVIAYANGIGCQHLFYGIGANSTAVINGMKTGQPAAAFQAMRTFKNAGGHIWLMGGAYGWLDEPTDVPPAAQTIIDVIAGNGNLFKGIHCDVEPWDLSANPNWQTTKIKNCTDLGTLYGTILAALPAGARISAAMTNQVATLKPSSDAVTFLETYQNQLHEIAMLFYWNTLEADRINTATARKILKKRDNWWFGQNFRQGGSGSWWKANPDGAKNETMMATLWDTRAKPWKAKGLAFYTYADLPSQLPIPSA